MERRQNWQGGGGWNRWYGNWYRRHDWDDYFHHGYWGGIGWGRYWPGYNGWNWGWGYPYAYTLLGTYPDTGYNYPSVNNYDYSNYYSDNGYPYGGGNYAGGNYYDAYPPNYSGADSVAVSPEPIAHRPATTSRRQTRPWSTIPRRERPS